MNVLGRVNFLPSLEPVVVSVRGSLLLFPPFSLLVLRCTYKILSWMKPEAGLLHFTPSTKVVDAAEK